ncbi:MAG: hypothetical protein ACFFD8_06060 [Candidatus Thorarchaeota archaeon]
MASPTLPWVIISALKAIIGEDYSILSFTQLPSRRNEVYKITLSPSPQSVPISFVAKLFHETGIANETSILQEAYQQEVPVPKIIGSTSNVLLLEYIPGPNLCDLITLKPDPLFGYLIATWYNTYHNAFRRGEGKVLTKGDARIRNFLVLYNNLVGVDFEESQLGSYQDDLAETCASILDTKPLFTKSKLQLCSQIIEHYATIQHLPNRTQFKHEVTERMLETLRQTSSRRGKPNDLQASIEQLEKTQFTL